MSAYFRLLTVIAVGITLMTIVYMVSCQPDITEEIRSELDCQTRWTDVTGKSHCGHLKFLVFPQVRHDSVFSEDMLLVVDTIRTFSSGANFLRVRRRISRTAASADCFFVLGISRLSSGSKDPAKCLLA